MAEQTRWAEWDNSAGLTGYRFSEIIDRVLGINLFSIPKFDSMNVNKMCDRLVYFKVTGRK